MAAPQVLCNTQVFLEQQASECTIRGTVGVQSGGPHSAEGSDPQAGPEAGGEHDRREVGARPVEEVDVTDLKS